MAEQLTFVDEFHDVLNRDVNFRRRSRDAQTVIAQQFLEGRDPEYRQLSTTPQGQLFRERLAGEFLDAALVPTTLETVQQKVEEFGPPLLGAAAAVATKRLPPQLLRLLGGPVGGSAAASGVGGGVSQVALEQARGLSTTLPPPPLGESVQRGAENLILFPALDLPVQGLLGATGAARQRLLAPGARDVVTQEARAALEPEGATLGLTQLSGEKTPFAVGLAEGIGEAGVGGRFFTEQRVRGVTQAVSNLAAKMEEALVPQLRPITQVGRETVDAVDLAHRAAQTIGHEYFQVVDNLSQRGVTVNVAPVMRHLTIGPSSQDVIRQFEIREILKQGQPPVRGYAGKTAIFDLARSAGPQRVTFADAQRMRSELLRIARDNEDALDAVQRQAGKQASTMAQTLLTQMDAAATQFDPTGQASTAYKFARDFWRDEVAGKFENELITRLVRQVDIAPSKVADILMSKNAFDAAQALKAAAPQQWNSVRREMLQNIIEKATIPEASKLGRTAREVVAGGEPVRLDGKALLRSFTALGRDYTRMMLQGTDLPNIRQFAMALEASERIPPQFGRVAVLLGQATAIGALAVTPFGGAEVTPGNVAIIAGPTALGYILSRPAMLRAIANGVMTGKTEIVTRAVAFANAHSAAERILEGTEAIQRASTTLPQLGGAPPTRAAFTQGPLPQSPLPPRQPPQLSTLPPLTQRRHPF